MSDTTGKHNSDADRVVVLNDADDLTVVAKKTERQGEETDVLEVVEENLTVEKRQVRTGAVRVRTVTDLREENVELELDRNVVEVTRVPVDRVVETVPVVRTEGDTTIVPVIEERLLIVKQLVLTEELHIRHSIERERVREPVELRRQRAIVERVEADGRAVEAGEADQQPEA